MGILASQDAAHELDGCRPCNVVWFDALEFEAVPEQVLPSVNELQLRTAEVVALHQIEVRKEQQDSDPFATPAETWKWLPGMFGMPVEIDGVPATRRPWLT